MLSGTSRRMRGFSGRPRSEANSASTCDGGHSWPTRTGKRDDLQTTAVFVKFLLARGPTARGDPKRIE
jgi:hypothetical protein